MYLKDQLKDTYQKASLDNNNFVLENVINRWVHRFGVQSINELIVKNQEQIILKGQDQKEENQEQIILKGQDQKEENQKQINLKGQNHKEENQDKVNLKLLKVVEYEKEKNSKSKEEAIFNHKRNTNKEIYEAYKNNSEYVEVENLPLPNINNLRKWINNNKKAS